MGCTISRGDQKAVAFVDQIVLSVASARDRDDVQLQLSIVASLQKIRKYVEHRKALQPIVLHEFNHAMTVIQHQRPALLYHLRKEIMETMLAITAKTPAPPGGVTVENMAYLADRSDHHSSQKFVGPTPTPGGGKYTNAVAKFIRETPMSTPDRSERKRLNSIESGYSAHSAQSAQSFRNGHHPSCHHPAPHPLPHPTPDLPTKALYMNDADFVAIHDLDSREDRLASHSTESMNSTGRFRSFYANNEYSCSQETLSDFGFFEEEIMSP